MGTSLRIMAASEQLATWSSQFVVPFFFLSIYREGGDQCYKQRGERVGGGKVTSKNKIFYSFHICLLTSP